MKEWMEQELGNYFKVKHGYAFKGKHFAKSGDYIVLTPGNFKEDGGLKSQGEKEKYYAIEPPKDYVLSEDQLLIVMTDLTQEARILGSPAFIRTSGKYLHNQRLGLVTDLDEEKLSQDYLYYLLNWSYVRDQLKATATGATVKHTAPDRIYAVVAPIPDLINQKSIVSALSSYDTLIENNSRRIEILEEMARRIYEEWFVHFRFPGHQEVKFKESELGMIPEGWEVKAIGEIALTPRKSVHPSKVDPEMPYIGLEHIPRKSITLKEWSTASTVDSNKLCFSKNDILFGKIRPYFHKVSVAPIDGICSSDTIILRSSKELYWGLMLCCVSSEAFVDHATQTSNGTKMPRANWQVLESYPVVIPEEHLLELFNETVRSMVKQCQTLMFKNANLRKQRDLLLPKLVSGEIDVSDFPMPEQQ